MQRCSVMVLGICCIVLVSTHVTWADEVWTGNFNVTLGAKALDEDDWEPVEDQGEFGMSVDFRQESWPVNLYIGLSGSSDEEDHYVINGHVVDIEGSTSELKIGVRKIWEPTPTMRPFIGGGLDIISAEFEGYFRDIWVDDDDAGAGFWLSGGVYWTVATNFNAGVEVGFSQATVTLRHEDIAAGGGHAGLLLGYHW